MKSGAVNTALNSGVIGIIQDVDDGGGFLTGWKIVI